MSKKHDLEFNKLAGSILLAGVLAMVAGIFADGLYEPKTPEKRGFHVEVSEDTGADAGKPTVEIDIGTLLASADATKGEGIAQKKCTSCHSFESGGADKVGPNLNGIMGAKIAHKDGFAYSDAVKNHGGTWGYEEMNHWLHGPAKYIKGNKMGFAGLKNDQERADVIMYLKSISPSAPGLPAPKPAAAPEAGKEAASPAVSDATPAKAGHTDNQKDTSAEIKASKDVKNPEANKEKDSTPAGTVKDPATQAVKQESKKAHKK